MTCVLICNYGVRCVGQRVPGVFPCLLTSLPQACSESMRESTRSEKHAPPLPFSPSLPSLNYVTMVIIQFHEDINPPSSPCHHGDKSFEGFIRMDMLGFSWWFWERVASNNISVCFCCGLSFLEKSETSIVSSSFCLCMSSSLFGSESDWSTIIMVPL